jgi:histidinol dehydrogenase
MYNLFLCVCLQVSTIDQAIDFSNMYASEHLIVNTEDAEAWLPRIQNAGSVFLGRWVGPG